MINTVYMSQYLKDFLEVKINLFTQVVGKYKII